MFSESVTLKEWLDENPALLPYLRICQGVTQRRTSLGIDKRESVHNRQKNDLLVELDKCNRTKKKISKSKEELEATPQASARHFLDFDKQTQNSDVHRLIYLEKLIIDEKLLVYDERIRFWRERRSSVRRLLHLFCSDIVPKSLTVIINKDFFSITEPEPAHLHYVVSIDACYRELYRTISSFNRPDWYNNDLAVEDAIRSSAQSFNDEYMFIEQHNDSFERYALTRCPEISSYTDSHYKDIPDTISAFCRSILPPGIDDQKDLSIGLQLLYQATICKATADHFSFFFTMKPKRAHKITRMADAPISRYSIPTRFMQEFSQDEPISAVFKRDSVYTEASSLLTTASLAPTPIDSLYFINRSLSMLHIGATANNNGPPEDIIPFDDLFSLFIGIFLSSDVFDPHGLLKELKRGLPTGGISPPFEYAYANIEALVLFIDNSEL